MLATNYQRVRLWSGVTAIGSNLALAWGLYLLSPRIERLLVGWPMAAQLLLIVLGGMFALLPLEILVGHCVERMVERNSQEFRAWLGDWWRGVTRYAIATTLGGMALGFGSILWWPWKLAVGALLLIAAFITAEQFFRLIPKAWRPVESPDPAFAASLREECLELHIPPAHLGWIDDSDDFAVNGAVASPVMMSSREENGMIIPAVALSTSVVRYLQPRQAALLVARELFFLESGYRRTALLLSVFWLACALGLAWTVPLGDSVLVSALGAMALISTWCVLSLFLWPALSRKWTRKADEFLLTIAPPEEVRDLLIAVQELNASDPTLSPAKQYIFHPIPTLENRLKALGITNEPNPQTSIPDERLVR